MCINTIMYYNLAIMQWDYYGILLCCMIGSCCVLCVVCVYVCDYIMCYVCERRKLTLLAQLVERTTFNRVVVGSIPTWGETTFYSFHSTWPPPSPLYSSKHFLSYYIIVIRPSLLCHHSC